MACTPDAVADAPYLKILDTLAKIREVVQNSGELALPQLCAIGDQSSGKSSLLQCLTGVAFPVKNGMCTKVPTVVQCRRSPHESVQIRAGATQAYKTINASEVGDEIAKLQAGLMESCAHSVCREQITIRIQGPAQQDYDVVDLPGIIHNGDGSNETRALIHSYVASKQTLILVVSEANQDKELTVALELAAQHDPEGQRTLRILTKFDTFDGEESRTAACVLVNALAGDALGPHAVVCRAPSGRRYDEEHEDEELKRGGEVLASDRAGVEALKRRLPPLYVELIRTNLPTLKRDALAVRDKAERELCKLGEQSLSATAMIVEAQRALEQPKHSFSCALTPAMVRLRDALHKTGEDITEELVGTLVRHDAFASPFFQGEAALLAGMAQVCEWWRPLFDRFVKEVRVQLEPSLQAIRQDAVGVSERLCVALDAQWERTCNELLSALRAELERVRIATCDYGTINHYLVQQYFATQLFSPKLTELVAEKLVENPHHRVSVDRNDVRNAINSVRDGVAAATKQEDIGQFVSGAVLVALKANWAVEKKTVTDLALKATRDTVIDARKAFVKAMLCNDTLRSEALEDDDVQQRRVELKGTWQRMCAVLCQLRELCVETDARRDSVGGSAPSTLAGSSQSNPKEGEKMEEEMEEEMEEHSWGF